MTHRPPRHPCPCSLLLGGGALPLHRPPQYWPASPVGLEPTGTAPGRSSRWPDQGVHSEVGQQTSLGSLGFHAPFPTVPCLSLNRDRHTSRHPDPTLTPQGAPAGHQTHQNHRKHLSVSSFKFLQLHRNFQITYVTQLFRAPWSHRMPSGSSH